MWRRLVEMVRRIEDRLALLTVEEWAEERERKLS